MKITEGREFTHCLVVLLSSFEFNSSTRSSGSNSMIEFVLRVELNLTHTDTHLAHGKLHISATSVITWLLSKEWERISDSWNFNMDTVKMTHRSLIK